MKLSEAMRLGAMMKPQAFGTFRDDEGSCALGAAVDAIGWQEQFMPSEWCNVLKTAVATCPQCAKRFASKLAQPSGVYGATYRVIEHLNDDHRWTREQIADFVESIEPASPVETPIASPTWMEGDTPLIRNNRVFGNVGGITVAS